MIKKERGITLVALIITILILVILAVVTIDQVFDLKIIETAIKGVERYSKEQIREEKDLDGIFKIAVEGFPEDELYETGEKVESGDYIKYDVEYTDMYKSYNYTSSNGWRLLSATDNGDGTYSNVELISTGIPIMWDYYNSQGNNEWWVTDTNKLNEFKSYLGKDGPYILASENLLSYNAFRASAGLYYNFKDSIFRYGTAYTGNYNQGRYLSIKNSGTTYSSRTSGTVKAGQLLQTDMADGVRLITLPEINKNLGRNDPDSLQKIEEDKNGLYNLDKLKNVPGIEETIEYTAGSGKFYWVASPYPQAGYEIYVCHLNFDGSMNVDALIAGGVRPVISIKGSKVIFNSSEDGISYDIKIVKEENVKIPDKEDEPDKPNIGESIISGDYIKYDVEYTDMYKSYNYTSSNGWRLLSATDNGDGTYSNVELISTGIPIMWDYYNSQGNNEWWVTDTNKLNEFKSYLGKDGPYILASENLLSYNAFRASAGLYYNFKDSIFRYGKAYTGNYNQGRYLYIKNSGTTYSSRTPGTVKAGQLLQTDMADGVRLITLPEINKNLGRNDPDNVLQINNTEDVKGLYRLDKLKNVLGINETISYTAGSGKFYWVASPYPKVGYEIYVCHLNFDGDMSVDGTIAGGVRPVISIKGSKVIFNSSENGSYYNIRVLN